MMRTCISSLALNNMMLTKDSTSFAVLSEGRDRCGIAMTAAPMLLSSICIARITAICLQFTSLNHLAIADNITKQRFVLIRSEDGSQISSKLHKRALSIWVLATFVNKWSSCTSELFQRNGNVRRTQWLSDVRTHFLFSVGFSSQFSGNLRSSLWMTARSSCRQRMSSSSCSIRITSDDSLP